MSILIRVLASASLLLCLIPLGASAQPPGDAPLMLQFKGTGDLMPIDEALALAGVDLARDTRLDQAEIDDFVANAAGCWPTAMLDARTQRQLGVGIDCLELLPGSDPAVGVSLRALSLFSFWRFQNSTIVTLGLTSVRPFVPGIGDADGGVTHMTGSIPAGPGGIVGGTGLFAGAAGTARVSGAVNLGGFPGALTFDCLWRLAIERDSLR